MLNVIAISDVGMRALQIVTGGPRVLFGRVVVDVLPSALSLSRRVFVA
jgi:hypothetical protein